MTRPNQRGLYECICGSVQADISIPSSRVKPMSILCSCRHCVGFTNGVIKASKPKYSSEIQAKGLVTKGQGAVHFAMFRNSNITLTKGQEYVRTCKLTESSGTTRIYASCCGTPLGCGGGGGFTTIHPQLLRPNPNKDQGEADLTAGSLNPSHCVHYKSAPKDAAPAPDGVVITDGPPPGLVFKFLVYMMRGIFAKKTGGLLGGPNAEPTIGLDSIVIE